MTPDELTQVLAKISAIEGRTYTAEEAEAWYEILRGRSLADTLTGTVAFYSKPFKRRAYPGDINALVEQIETKRVESIGSPELNEQDWIACTHPGTALRTLYQHVRKGTMTPASYSAYRKSGLTLDAFMGVREVPTDG